MKPQLIIDSNERGLLCESVERKATKAGLTVARQAWWLEITNWVGRVLRLRA